MIEFGVIFTYLLFLATPTLRNLNLLPQGNSFTYIFVFFVFDWPTAYGVPSQGSDVGRGGDLHPAEAMWDAYLIHCAGLRIEPASQHSRGVNDSVAPQQKLLIF